MGHGWDKVRENPNAEAVQLPRAASSLPRQIAKPATAFFIFQLSSVDVAAVEAVSTHSMVPVLARVQGALQGCRMVLRVVEA